MRRFYNRPAGCTLSVQRKSLSWSIGMRCSRTSQSDGRYMTHLSQGQDRKKRFKPDTEEAGDEGVGRGERPEDRKAAKKEETKGEQHCR